MAAALEPSQSGRFLDEGAPLLGRRGEDLPRPSPAPIDGRRAAEADVGQQLDEVGAAHGRPVDEVLPFAAAVQPARDRDLLEVEPRQRAVRVVEAQLDLAVGGRLAASRAREEHVIRLLGAELARARLPEAQSSASATFDFPEPFGPTTTATPGSRRTSTGSGNDLKPRMEIARRYTAAQR